LTISDGWRADWNGVVTVEAVDDDVMDDVTAGGGAATSNGVADAAPTGRRGRATPHGGAADVATTPAGGNVQQPWTTSPQEARGDVNCGADRAARTGVLWHNQRGDAEQCYRRRQ